ncbi:MAG: 50S ribosomal protein L25 [Phycisphaerales bacterium]
MSRDAVNLKAQKRDRLGSRYARRLRASGQLPAVIYGHKQDPVPVSVDQKETLTHLHHGVRLFSVEVDGETENCLVRDLQFDHLGTDVIHVDLARIDLNEEVTVNATLKFIGEPEALKTPGAIFRVVNETIEIRCIVSEIPEEIPVDVTNLQVGEHLSASDIQMPEGIKLESDDDLVIARVAVVQEEEEAPEEDTLDEPEIISERGDDDEDSDEDEKKSKGDKE